jgi:hypothetical protein
MHKIGQIPIFTEKTVTEPGWYWFEPACPGMTGGYPKFIQVDQDAISDGWLKCRKYAGKYAGPIEPPDMSCQHRGPVVRYEQMHNVHKCDECGAEFPVID